MTETISRLTKKDKQAITARAVAAALADYFASVTKAEAEEVFKAIWYGSSSHQIASDCVGNVSISTAFIGLSAGEIEGLPILFETLRSSRGVVRRYTTDRQALDGHAEIVSGLAGLRM